MTAHDFLLSIKLEDKYIGVPRLSSAVPVDASAVCVSELMEYWRKQDDRNTQQEIDEILLQENASLKQAIMLCAKDFGIDPGDYLHDVLTRDAIGELIEQDAQTENGEKVKRGIS